MGLKFVVFFLFLIAAYLCWFALEFSVFIWLLAALLPLLCGVGLALRLRWASYLWYILAVGASANWLIVIVGMVLRGWRANSAVEYVIDLTPGLLLLAIAAGGSVAVRRAFTLSQDLAP